MIDRVIIFVLICESLLFELEEVGLFLIKKKLNVYDYDFTKRNSVIVFGTESSGLSREKSSLLDSLVKIPMGSECQFLTLPTAVPIVAYEFYRQIREGQK